MDRILAHERVHIKQRHSLDILLMELIAIVQWFNPFVWPYKKSLKETHEYLADQAVIAQGCSKSRYQRLIFEQHLGERLYEFTNSFKQSNIKRRLTMMTKNESKGRAKWKILLVLPMAVILLMAFAEPRIVVQTGPAAESGLAGEMSTSSLQGQTSQEKEKSEEQKKKEKEMKEKEWMLEMKEEVKLLSEKKKKIQSLLENENDSERKAELKDSLVKILQEEEIMAAEMAEAGVKVKIFSSEADGNGSVLAILESKYKEGILVLEELKVKEDALKKKLESVDDPETKTKLKQSLANVLAKQEDLRNKIQLIAREIKAEKK